MELSPDSWTMLQLGTVALNATLVFTWAVMGLLTLAAAALRLGLSTGPEPSRLQSWWEALVETVEGQIGGMGAARPRRFLPFVATLFLFIATCNVLAVVPGFRAPTGSLSTAAALALCVLVAVPAFGIARKGIGGYLADYLRPTPLMLPFNIIGELSRTVALAVRLYGNMMSGAVLGAILLGIAPFLFPVALELLGLLTGRVQASVFAVLAMVYIASATRAAGGAPERKSDSEGDG